MASSIATKRGRTTATQIRVVGARPLILRDGYHLFLRMPWSLALALIVGAYLALNAGFALAYARLGGVANLPHGAFVPAFYFSIQTMGTIGYGAMYPVGTPANLLMVLESVTGLVVTALATGLLFAKFSRITPRIVFTSRVTISPMDGVPTLMFRVGNERSSQIIEATVRVIAVRTETTREGQTFYRLYDMTLARERSPAVSRSWTVMHPITPSSPIYGLTPTTMREQEIEFIVTLTGIDDTSLQPIHARQQYAAGDVVWGARPADVLTDDGEKGLVLDVRLFDELTPTQPVAEFPYPAAG